MTPQALYYLACAIGWIVVCVGGYLLFQYAGRLRRQSRLERRAIVALILFTATFIALNYLLWYPVAVSRLSYPWLDLFVPAEWVYDHTFLRGPLRAAGESLGVAGRMDEASYWRMRSAEYWGSTPPWLYATGWIALCVAIVAGATFAVAGVERVISRMTRSREQLSQNPP